MYLVVDANILFSALIKESKSSELMLSDKLELIAPEYLFLEFKKYENLILTKTHRSKQEFFKVLSIFKNRVSLIQKDQTEEFFDEAEKICPDKKDIPYFSLCMKFRCPLWSNDSELKEQNSIKVLNTHELNNFLNKEV